MIRQMALWPWSSVYQLEVREHDDVRVIPSNACLGEKKVENGFECEGDNYIFSVLKNAGCVWKVYVFLHPTNAWPGALSAHNE